MKRVQEVLKGVLFHRETLKKDLADISLVGAIFILLFYTSKDLWLPTAIALILSPPGLGGSDILTIWNLILATFPLTIGMCVIIKITAYCFAKKKFLFFWSFYGMPIVFFISLALSVFLGLGSIHGSDLVNILKQATCSDSPECLQKIKIIESSAHPEGVLGIYINRFIFVTLSFFWLIYGARVFLLAILLSFYIDWAIFIKIMAHFKSEKLKAEREMSPEFQAILFILSATILGTIGGNLLTTSPPISIIGWIMVILSILAGILGVLMMTFP